MDPDSSSDDDVNAGMTQLRLSGDKLLELPDELLAIIGVFAPTGGLVRSSRRCLKVMVLASSLPIWDRHRSKTIRSASS